MTDLPPGQWTELLIGDQWPSSTSLDLLSHSTASRRNSASWFDQYADLLNNIRIWNLSSQEGAAADHIRASFAIGYSDATSVGERNRTKSESYTRAFREVTEFRNALTGLAAEGNEAIDQINKSNAPLAVKTSEIVQVISEIRTRAAVEAANQTANIYSAIQEILNVYGIDSPARTFAADNGVDSAAGLTPRSDELQGEVTTKLEQLEQSALRPSSAADNAAPPASLYVDDGYHRAGHPAVRPSPILDNSAPPSVRAENTAMASHVPLDTLLPQPDTGIGRPSPSSDNAAPPPMSVLSPGTVSRLGFTNGAMAPSISSPAAAPAVSALSPSPTIEAHAPASALDYLIPASLQSAATFSPEHLAETFNAGQQIGSPVSAAAEAISQAAASPVHTPHTASIAPLEASTPAAPLIETAHAAAPAQPIVQIPSSPTEVAHPVLTPAPAMAPTIQAPAMSAAIQAAPPSSLLAYGADVRPSAVTAPAAPALPPPALPGSAPVNSASAGQPALVRQQPMVSTSHAPAVGLTERAVAATVTGAAAGIAAENAAAQSRLHRLLDAVARQQPRLRWAIGDLEDGNTVLVTDLADGWIPPGVAIPTGVRLLNPAVRRGDLTALLGPAVHIAAYQPGQHLPPADAAPPPAMSVRARDTTAVDDLGWELSQATKWRDGLPRLAHTLAKSVSSGTGVLESEAELLRDHMTDVARAVIAGYPAAVDRAQVCNWQLLATIDALIADEKRLANYHFAWFQAHALTREGRR